MTDIKFKTGIYEEENDLGNVAMFGFDSRGHENFENRSCFFLPYVVIGGLDISIIVFLLFILYEVIPVNCLIYILVPLSLNCVLSFADFAIETCDTTDSSRLSSFNLIRSSGLIIQASIFLFLTYGARFALIYKYSKILSKVVSAVGSLKALADFHHREKIYFVKQIGANTLEVCNFMVPYVGSMVLLCICLYLRIAYSIRHVYAFALSFIDMLGSSIFLLNHSLTGGREEIRYFNQIINDLPLLVMRVAAARCLVWFLIPFIFARKEDRRGIYLLGLIHLCVALANAFFYKRTDFGIILILKMFCYVAMVERFLMICINVYLGYKKRQASLLRDNTRSSLGRRAATFSSSPTIEMSSIVEKNVI